MVEDFTCYPKVLALNPTAGKARLKMAKGLPFESNYLPLSIRILLGVIGRLDKDWIGGSCSSGRNCSTIASGSHGLVKISILNGNGVIVMSHLWHN
jgi:hypothetical protein